MAASELTDARLAELEALCRTASEPPWPRDTLVVAIKALPALVAEVRVARQDRVELLHAAKRARRHYGTLGILGPVIERIEGAHRG